MKKLLISLVSFPETALEHAARLQWFRDPKLGMFIHWGLYPQLFRLVIQDATHTPVVNGSQLFGD